MIHRFAQLGQAPSGPLPSNRSDIERNNPLIQQHDTESADHGLSASLSEEMIAISGAQVIVYLRTDNSDHDDVWEEDADPTYFRGKRLKAFFVPQVKATELTQWGADSPNQTTVVFSKSQVQRELGRMIRIGDVLELPYNGSGEIAPSRYKVLNSFDSGNFRYEWYYWSCVVENLLDDITINPEN